MPRLPFSRFIRSGDFIFASGQIHLTSDGSLLEGTVSELTHQVMKNVQIVLEEAGTSWTDVVKTTIFMTDLSMYAEVNDVYVTYLTELFPAREAVGVKELPLGASIEMSVVAYKPE